MVRSRVSGFIVATSLLVSACGDSGGGGGGPIGAAPTPTPTPAPTPAATPTPTGTCSLRARQDWSFATLKEHYLFPETLPAALDPGPFTTVDSYIDALTATARGQRRDRFFTYLTSIAEENAFFSSGATAGFGIRLAIDSTARRLFVSESFENAPALSAGIDRGTEIVAIGASATTLRTVTDIIASEGSAGVTNALGPNTVGTARTLRVVTGGTTSTVNVAKADFQISPVSTRYGAQIINDGGRRVGYLNLRTFISTADDQLRSAFNQFRTAGITNFIIDFRYNGGGLVSTAELMGDLLGGNRTTSQVFSITSFRPEKSASNSTKRFAPVAQSVSPVKVAFIGTGSTASASELVINSFIPYLGQDMALIGSNTFGKPVGQIAIDRAACDDRLRVVAFATQNSAGQANYFDGLAPIVPRTCRANDDVTRPLGDPQEASTRAALNFIGGVTCTPISATGALTQSSGRSVAAAAPAPEALIPVNPNVPQREMPGLF